MSNLETQLNKIRSEVLSHPSSELETDVAVGLRLVGQSAWAEMATEAEEVSKRRWFYKSDTKEINRREKELSAQPGGKELLRWFYYQHRQTDLRNGVRDEGVTDHGYW